MAARHVDMEIHRQCQNINFGKQKFGAGIYVCAAAKLISVKFKLVNAGSIFWEPEMIPLCCQNIPKVIPR